MFISETIIMTSDLEQDIMNAWNVVDDLQLLSEKIENLSQDSLMNILIGMAELYQLKFEKLFEAYEQSLKK